jgi:RND family efflux transporter MFP subunit
MKKLVMSFLSLFIIVFVCSYAKFRDTQNIGVRTIKVEPGPISSYVHATGTVKSTFETQMSPLIAGRISAVLVKNGQFVAKGTLLAKIDQSEADAKVSSARATLRGEKQKCEQAKRTKESLRLVWKVGGASWQEFKNAESQFQIALAEKDKAEADLREAYIEQNKYKVKAPFAGIVTKSSAHIGEWARPGTSLFTLTDMAAREVELMVDDADTGMIAVGQRVELSCDAFPGRTWTEEVKGIDAAVQKNGLSNIVNVHIHLESDLPELRPGQQIDGKIRISHKKSVLKVPYDALLRKESKVFVAVINTGKIHMIPIITGMEDAIHVEVVEGIHGGQEIILPEGRHLKEGLHVHKMHVHKIKAEDKS